jgi:hypothetical protein
MQATPHLASGDLCHEGAPLGKGAVTVRADFLVVDAVLRNRSPAGFSQ